MLLDPHKHMLEWEKQKYTVYRNKYKVERDYWNKYTKLTAMSTRKNSYLDWEDREATCKW